MVSLNLPSIVELANFVAGLSGLPVLIALLGHGFKPVRDHSKGEKQDELETS